MLKVVSPMEVAYVFRIELGGDLSQVNVSPQSWLVTSDLVNFNDCLDQSCLKLLLLFDWTFPTVLWIFSFLIKKIDAVPSKVVFRFDVNFFHNRHHEIIQEGDLAWFGWIHWPYDSKLIRVSVDWKSDRLPLDQDFLALALISTQLIQIWLWDRISRLVILDCFGPCLLTIALKRLKPNTRGLQLLPILLKTRFILVLKFEKVNRLLTRNKLLDVRLDLIMKVLSLWRLKLSYHYWKFWLLWLLSVLRWRVLALLILVLRLTLIPVKEVVQPRFLVWFRHWYIWKETHLFVELGLVLLQLIFFLR